MQTTTAIRKILFLKKRIRAIQGGSAAGKTIGIVCDLIDQAQRDKKPALTSIVSESFPHLKRGAMRDFQNIMEQQGYFNPQRWNKTDFIYTFETGSKIEFFSADMSDKVRGPRRQRLFINEVNNISFETFEQLEIRTEELIYLDWNPVSEFWFYDKVKMRPDVDFLVLTYKDNEGLSKSIVDSIEQRKNRKGWWQVFGLGQLGEVEGKIYFGWQIIDEIPHEARLERYGLDFGYTNDETAIAAVYYYNGGWIFDEVVYKKGMSNKDIADTLKTIPEKLTIADSAEPKSIDEIRSYGLNVQPAFKGKDSVRVGIQLIQDQPISITKRSVSGIKEYRNSFWAMDKDGNMISPNIPEKEGHFLAAARYAMSTLCRPKPVENYWDKIWSVELSGINSCKRPFNKGR